MTTSSLVNEGIKITILGLFRLRRFDPLCNFPPFEMNPDLTGNCQTITRDYVKSETLHIHYPRWKTNFEPSFFITKDPLEMEETRLERMASLVFCVSTSFIGFDWDGLMVRIPHIEIAVTKVPT